MTSITNKPQAQTDHDIHPLITKRWSPRAFAEQPISTDTLNRLFEAARWAASSYNEQPWRFVYAHKGSEAYDKLMSSINPFNQAWAKSAPLLILGIVKNGFSHNSSENRHAMYDLGAAVANMSLQGTEEGIYFHQMAGFDPDQARQSFGIPEEYTPVVAIAAGYLGDAATLPENLREKEYTPKQRNKIEAFAFEGEFNTTA
ncbi:MAG: nitroreductase family protein [Cyclobacteriaceae bacterium]